MKRRILVALILILALLLGCSPKAPVISPTSKEAPPSATTEAAVPTPTAPTTSNLTSPPPSMPPTLPTPPTATPTKPLPPLDAFMKGIHFNDWNVSCQQRPPNVGPLYNPAQTDGSLRNLAATGANWISVIVFFYQETISSTNITRSQYGTATDSALRHVIDLGHSLGMRAALLPGLLLSSDPGHKWFQIGTAFTTEAQWQDWFASYREFINHYASFAQEAGVDMLYVGSELAGVTHREDDWRRIIREVRQRFTGPISYDSIGIWYGEGDAKRIKWWDAVDYIALDVWYPLTGKNDPTVAELKEAWIKRGYIDELENFSKQFNRPFIISEIGYHSVDGTNRSPLNNLYERLPLDLQEQADCYQAALEVLWGRPWLKGIFWFQWPAIPVWWPPDRMIKSSVPCGKPAEEIIKRFFLSQ